MGPSYLAEKFGVWSDNHYFTDHIDESKIPIKGVWESISAFILVCFFFFQGIFVGLGSGALFFFCNDLQLSPFYPQQYVWKELPLPIIPSPEIFL